jgi:transcriptional regulator with XRE-family HTH domain
MEPRRNQDPERLRRRRIESGLSQVDLADRAGISKSHMSMIEGGRAGASPRVLQRLADVMDCEVADLMPVEVMA